MIRFLFTFLLAGSLGLLSNLQADVMIPLPLDALTARAELVLHGEVVSITVQRDSEGRIFTRVDLRVDEVMKGTLATNRFNLVHGGGLLGEERSVVSGQAEYEVGEEIVAFVVLNPRGEGVTIGLSQGKFHISTDPVTGEKLAQNRFHGLSPTGPESKKNPPGSTVIHERLPLADLKATVLAGGAK